MFALSNVPRTDSWRFWLLLVVEYGIAVFVCFHIIYHFSLYCRDRRRYRAAPNPSNYAILIQDVPLVHCSEKIIHRYWNRLLPDQVAGVFLIHDASRLERDKKKFWNAVAKREVAELRLHEANLKSSKKKSKKKENAWNPTNNPYTRKPHSVESASGTFSHDETPRRLPKFLCGPPRDPTQAIEYWREQQVRYWAHVSAHLIKSDEGQFPETQSAIVVFKSRQVAAIAAQTNFSRKEDEWRVSRAPEPTAINWSALGISSWTVYVRQCVTALLCVSLTLFWIVPVTAIMGLVNLSKLAQLEIGGEKPFLFFDQMKEWSPLAVGFIESWLPTVILTVFLAIVPNILHFFVSISRIVSHAQKDGLVRDWYFVFITFSNFLFVAFAGTFLDELAVILDKPTSTVEILARNIPKQAAFMMNFIVLAALTETPRELLQLVRVGKRWSKLRFIAKTKRQREEADVGDSSMDYVGFYAMGQLVSLLGLIYCTIQPFIVFCCVGYFGISYIVFKYNVCFTTYNDYEAGGRMFGGSLYSIWLGLFLHLLTMIGVFGLNKSAAQSALIIVPSVLAVLFVLHCNKSFDRVLEHGSVLETQDRIEELEGRKHGCDEIEPGLVSTFQHPSFEALPDPHDLDNLSGVADLVEQEKTGAGWVEDEALTVAIDSCESHAGSRVTVAINGDIDELRQELGDSEATNNETDAYGSSAPRQPTQGHINSLCGPGITDDPFTFERPRNVVRADTENIVAAEIVRKRLTRSRMTGGNADVAFERHRMTVSDPPQPGNVDLAASPTPSETDFDTS
ncbi:unnamed protein product [Chondrus crispus]|uniref:CSC1/OSCA1-like 7TM region domain-containing protein n=1 Tax=Chondrus crispus TaxID=2769 RepID=R7QGA3_CHOCR|nr:unnamed protein product [Chondrus crispus]CDF37109.1 unnamed protein product [Chondrus crispus]|eukprot:XP_005716928.1 unnamed protein product [Chondrus crispus]